MNPIRQYIVCLFHLLTGEHSLCHDQPCTCRVQKNVAKYLIIFWGGMPGFFAFKAGGTFSSWMDYIIGFFALGSFRPTASAVFVVVRHDKDTSAAAADLASITDWIPVTASSSTDISSAFIFGFTSG
jgi:hypothetical protein